MLTLAIALYLGMLLALIWYSSYKSTRSDFLNAGNSVEWKLLSLSIFSSVLSGYNLVLGITFSFLYGPWILLVYLAIPLALFALFFFANSQDLDKSQHTSKSFIDWASKRYSSKVATVFHLILGAALLLLLSLQFFVNTNVLTQVYNFDAVVVTIAVGIVVLSYTAIGGLKTEIYTDSFQAILLILIVGLVFFVDLNNVGSAALLKLSDTSLIIPAMVLGIVQVLTVVVQPELWQRVYAAKSSSDMSKGLIGGAFLILLVILPIIIIGIAAFGANQEADPNTIFYALIESSIPEWLLPIVIVALIAGFMSSIDSTLFAFSSQFAKHGFLINGKSNQARVLKLNETNLIRVIAAIAISISIIISLFFVSFLTSVMVLISLMTVISSVVIMSSILNLEANMVFPLSLLGVICFVGLAFAGEITSDPMTVLYPSLIVVVASIFLGLLSRLKVIGRND